MGRWERDAGGSLYLVAALLVFVYPGRQAIAHDLSFHTFDNSVLLVSGPGNGGFQWLPTLDGGASGMHVSE